jgi:nitrogen regulatory protein P-II 2
MTCTTVWDLSISFLAKTPKRAFLLRNTLKIDATVSAVSTMQQTSKRPWSKLEAVKEALSKVAVFRMTIVDVQGFGRQKGHTEVYRGHELTVNLLRKVQLQIAVNEDFVEPTVNAITEAGRTGPEGRIGDGKIFILPLEDCIRIRTGERGPEAI